ncbi:hypothetical protein GOODEAATRI_003846 [Goodea atripinnis]|uniref:Rubicon PI3K-binding domain-containing protein n=1 Tax=Goodea atripinnis TaxID=208336 RepID=A0ABV0NRK7_9TELE
MMEVTAEGEAEERRREQWKLLSSLKTTVEGLLSTNNPNVWSRYGGLQRLHKDMNNILGHRLKNEQVRKCSFVSLIDWSDTAGFELRDAQRWGELQGRALSPQPPPFSLRPGIPATATLMMVQSIWLSVIWGNAVIAIPEAPPTAASQTRQKNSARSRVPWVQPLRGAPLSRRARRAQAGGPKDTHAHFQTLGSVKNSGMVKSASEDSCMKDYSPFSPRCSDASTPSSLHMESRESSHILFETLLRFNRLSSSTCCFTRLQVSTLVSYGPQYSTVPDGMFRKPSKGQSLISYLSEQDFGSCADLEKENAHFSISESLIAAIELMKYNILRQEEEGEEEGDSDSEIQQLKQKIRLRRQQIRRSRLPPCTTSQHRTPS